MFLAHFDFDIFLQPLMLIVPDVEDVYTPLQSDIIVPVSEVRFLDFWVISFCLVVSLEVCKSNLIKL